MTNTRTGGTLTPEAPAQRAPGEVNPMTTVQPRPTTEQPLRPRRRTGLWIGLGVLTLILLAVVVAVLLSRPQAEPEPPAPPPVDPAVAQQEADTAAAIAVLERYDVLSDEAYQAGSLDGIRLDEVAAPAFIEQMREILASRSTQGLVYEGDSVMEIDALPLSYTEVPARTVRLEFCADISQSSLTFPDGTDARVGPDGGPDYNERFPGVATVQLRGGTWLVTDITVDAAETC